MTKLNIAIVIMSISVAYTGILALFIYKVYKYIEKYKMTHIEYLEENNLYKD
jgi:hypothetical protein